MTTIGKMAQKAVSAVSCLAEVYADDVSLNASQIAERRGLSTALVGKLMTTLSSEGIVVGTPGRGGGFRLKNPPAELSLFDVVSLFGQVEKPMMCPLGASWCGNGPPCAMHQHILDLHEMMVTKLKEVNFEGFREMRPDVIKEEWLA
ncbi:RrF2 family transcriptional regulator [Sulfuriroseicoccus oceanibius]|uniref:Rrf2 family transcriptional regulator n=1 Tax=Sulfuriroseicoccus oceanibius TaxID=2707525 RepID=A0A6B3L445_9BACT|nr:Rrf2 family transcriptional regulator [Sulfuriroseicoccus oceanibius]QQL44852.1 Rrf2 family transcriptional regulator [Sulfuriroseicoccus oceanibius]